MKKGKEKQKGNRLAEITAVLMIFFGLFCLISLISYDSRDPSWANVPPAGHSVHNYAGRVGAYFAEAFLQFLGLVAFFMPFAFGYVGLKTILPGGSKRMARRIGGALLAIVILCPLLFLLLESFPWGKGEIRAGGILGDLLSSFLVGYLNHTGSLILLAGALVLFLLFATHWSLTRTVHLFGKAFDSAFKDVRIKVTRYQKTREREKRREKVHKKWADAQTRKESEAEEAAEEKGGKPSRSERQIEKQKEKERKKLEKEARKKPREVRVPLEAPKHSQPEAMLFPDLGKKGDYSFPPFSLLDPGKPSEKIDKNELIEKKRRIEEKLKEFNVAGEVREYHPGPVITTYELFPDPGIKVAQVANLTEDLSLALEAESVRIQRIPGKSSLGVEIPNNKREVIKLRDIVQSEKFLNSPSKLTFALGKTVHGEVYITDLASMPHLLIAGATGTGKSVALNSLIASILYKATPDEVKLILIDPKRLEFSLYEGIPHLLCPVINDPKKAGIILFDAVRKMEERLRLLGRMKVRDIVQFNKAVEQTIKEKNGKLTEEEQKFLKPLPYIVIIIDELAELMMISAQEVEASITRLAQLARAVGIHLVMATQRPSIDVITGTIKANLGCRIAFRVSSKIDSRIILDAVGAEKLLGLGDMLFLPPNFPRLLRLHCSYISIPEVKRLIKFVKEQGVPEYDERIVQAVKGDADQLWEEMGEKDELYEKAVELVLLTGQASASYLQRRLKLGYARAARIIDQMEGEGIIGPSEGAKPREVLVDPKSYRQEQERRKAGED
jgi:DNA segregation ATPase FtsK/SpoIIIE, S-DNA-T family